MPPPTTKKRPSDESTVQKELSKLNTDGSSDKDKQPIKKPKKMSPIQMLLDGEQNCDILLKIVTVEARQLRYGPFYTVYATDGHEFIQLEATGRFTEKLVNAIKHTDKGKYCYLEHLEVKTIKPEYNFGSVPYALKVRENTTIKVVDSIKEGTSNEELRNYDQQQGFHAYLKKRFCFDPKEANGALSLFGAPRTNGNISTYMQFKIDKVSPLFTYQKPNINASSQIFHADISSAETKLRFSAWNMEAEFINTLFGQAVGLQFICKDVYFKNDDQYGAQLTFGRQSKIALLQPTPQNLETMPTSLAELVALSNYQKMNIKLQLLDNPSPYATSAQVAVAHDNHHKCQLFFPIDLKPKKGAELKVLGATVEMLPSGVFNLKCNSDSDIVLMPQAAINPELLPKKFDFAYPTPDDVVS